MCSVKAVLLQLYRYLAPLGLAQNVKAQLTDFLSSGCLAGISDDLKVTLDL